jgi:hypothetical protein
LSTPTHRTATDPLHDANDAAPRASARFTPLQGVVAASLAIGLTFIVVSNYRGWTARVEVTSIKKDCDRPGCQKSVFVRGREQPFRVARERGVEVGDRAEIRGKCDPRCKLELVSFAKANETR